MSNEVIYVGWINKGKTADCGETMKNQLCISKLETFGVKCLQMDFKNWRKHPWVLIQLAWNMLTKKNATLILSTSAKNVYPLMKLMKTIGWRGNSVHWVIGGNFGQKVQNNDFKAETVNYMKHTLVESRLMVEQLEACGVTGVKEVPNFKPIEYYPALNEKYPATTKPLRLVFLSRIMPEKGCDYIFEAAGILNEEGFADKYIIDFYGKVKNEYKDVFFRKISMLENVNYKGFLNLRIKEGYDQLAAYDAMLFPTYWISEGLAGVFIDAFIAGVPMIATDWAHNKAFLQEEETALFIPVHDVMALKNKIQECIEGKYDLQEMSKKCQKEADRFNVDNVITEGLLKEIGVL
ncbi:glycosyltransferase family 4 protein [[Clostridium] aminophilum]|uniref:Glycosyl transferases group 1 n=1 Tax=[Clostridium] aminophilum TaxID=1526 RepID=A0A1I6JKW9_9FIRM|nr:glycosyltransferase [[Clostridium] aminophilum]SFR79547.1 Glycosyl transferases group 1 [[Clostridium] aminophilum]